MVVEKEAAMEVICWEFGGLFLFLGVLACFDRKAGSWLDFWLGPERKRDDDGSSKDR